MSLGKYPLPLKLYLFDAVHCVLVWILFNLEAKIQNFAPPKKSEISEDLVDLD